MFTKILVPLDGSELAERALTPALTLAQRGAGRLVLIQVPAPDLAALPEVAGGYIPASLPSVAHDSAVAYLATRQQAYANANVPLQVRVLEGSAADVIVEAALTEKADLIVMSSHGYSGFTRWVLGSVAERVLHAAPCPVLVMRSPEPIRQILIPLDGSSLAERALAPGLEIAQRMNATVTLLRAISPVPIEAMERLEGIELGLGRRLEGDLYEEAHAYLTQVASAHPSAEVELKLVVITDRPAEAILTYAEHHAVDVIAMSTHGYTGLKRWTYGSVTDKVLREARACSMLVVRPTTA